MNPVPPEADHDLPDAGEAPPPGVSQDFSAFGQARQAVQGSGIQNIYLGRHGQAPEPTISIAPPVGQRDENLPIRGRDELLSELTDGAIGPRVWVIHGLGGSGKTRLVLEVAFAAQQRGIEVWWVSAADADTLAAGMRAVGRRLGVAQEDLERGDSADILWQRLAARQHAWLLVIDGADDPQVLSGAGSCLADGRGWLRPVTGQIGLVIATSRDGGAASWGAWCHRRRLAMLAATEAAAVLADHAGSYPRLGSADDAQTLAIRLGGLPLALKIAGSYLASSASIPAGFTDAGTITTYQGYREAMDAGQPGEALTQPSEQMTQLEVQTLIGRTWELTLDRLDARQLPEARKVLQLLATFADAPVPYELLLSPQVLAASPILPGITGTRLWQAMTALDDFGLLELSAAVPESTAVSVVQLHPLVRDTSRPDAGSDDRMMFLVLASRLLEQAVRKQPPEDPVTWPAFQLLVPHIEEIFERLAAEPDCPDDAVISAAHAAFESARYRSRQGFRTQAETLYRTVLEVTMRVLGPEHPNTLETRHQLAHEIGSRGDHPTAEAEHRAVLDTQTRVLGPDNPSTLNTRRCLANEIAARGDHPTAEAEYRAVLEAEARVLGPDSRSALATRHQLAREIAARGDHAAAEAESRAVLDARTRILGPDNPSTLSTRHFLAHQIAARGDHATAEAEHRAVLDTQTRILGPDNPSTLRTRHCLAHEIAARGDHATAEAEHRAVLEAETRILGPDNPYTLITRHCLAHEIAARGDHATAEAEYRAVLEAETRILGPDNPSALATRYHLAGEIAARGDHAAAEAEYRAVLEAETRILGPDNPSTLNTRRVLAKVCHSAGRLDEAISLYESVLADCERALGSEHSLTRTVRSQAGDTSAQRDI